MNKTDEYIISFYLHLVEDVCKDAKVTREFLLVPDGDILKELYGEFLDSVNQAGFISHTITLGESGLELPEDAYMEDLDEKVDEKIAEAIKEAVIYMLNYLQTSKYYDLYYENLINHILRTPMKNIVSDFREKKEYSFEIFENYVRYLVERHFDIITLKDETNLERKYSWLAKLTKNRGFISLNDKARWSLRALFDMYFDSGTNPNELYNLLDKYFNDYSYEPFIAKYASEFNNSKENIKAFKAFQTRIMIGDVYRYLKGTALMNEEYEIETKEEPFLEVLESRLENGEYTLPEVPSERYELYKQFYLMFLGATLIPHYNDSLTNSGDVNTLKPVNPMYFID